ncbi:ABC transporter permease [Algisphaera agarilytica]|uniref:NitT/TauT family transport system permease protein n=1 Tax=Algisphaera agarilytica TaxID=1385975 RepID=A0A7X0H2W6_9BACT|nr:ABC transporter permease [Algisphaera agarilytica]MBB6428246.1 NitT/TauT family transport system permease protein [Algisphaera agarilytica]
MSETPPPKPPRDPWFRIRTNLTGRRRAVLMILSFVLPIAIWSLATYLPAFQSEIKFTLVTEKIGNSAAFSVGDRIDKEYFSVYLDQVRDENKAILEAREAGDAKGSSRANKKRLRQLMPLAESMGVMDGVPQDDFAAVDGKLFSLYGSLAEGTATVSNDQLTAENLEIVKANWELLKEFAPYDSKNFIKTPLLHLLPQGVSSSPVFLPPPHECLIAAWDDFTKEPANQQPWMYERLLGSLKVVFGAFLLACLIGIPIGLLCGTYDFFAKLIEPFTDFFRYMPAPTFGLLLQAIFGVAGAPKIAMVFIGTFPHMILMLGNTTRQLDRGLLEAAQTLGAKPRALFTKVIVPGIMPRMYNDLRVLLGWAWTWLVIAELIGEKTGLTAFIDTQGGKYNFDRVFPVIIMIGIIGFLTDQILQWIARGLFPWEYNTQGGFISKIVGLPGRLLSKIGKKEEAIIPAETA